MSGQCVLVPISGLSVTADQLTAIISELESASSKQDDVEEAVDRPYGDSRLKERCHDFEGSWNDSRDKLLTNLKKVLERVNGTIEEVTTLDTEIAQSMSSSGSSSGASRPAAI